jgi:glutamine amidotransferase
MGWNEVLWTADHPLTRGIPSGSRFYFVHSYAPDVIPGVTAGVTTHGREFTAAVGVGSVFATQFHPERSGEAGLALYEAFVKEIS